MCHKEYTEYTPLIVEKYKYTIDRALRFSLSNALYAMRNKQYVPLYLDIVNDPDYIGQNDLIEPGSKCFYLRIADPSKNIISKGMGDEYAFMYQGDLLQYTEKVIVSYENKEKDVCAYYIKPAAKEMQPGYYFVDIYDDNNNLVGQTSFNLR